MPLCLQVIMWELINQMPVDNKDYLQVFSLYADNGKQRLTHIIFVTDGSLDIDNKVALCGNI